MSPWTLLCNCLSTFWFFWPIAVWCTAEQAFCAKFSLQQFFFLWIWLDMTSIYLHWMLNKYEYVWLDKKGDKNCTWRHFIWGKKEFAPHWKSEMDRFFLYQIQTDAVNCNEEMISSFLIAVQSTIEVSQCIEVISDGALFVFTILSLSLSALDFWKTKFDKLSSMNWIFCSISNLNFAGYTGSKNAVHQTWCFKLRFAKIKSR